MLKIIREVNGVKRNCRNGIVDVFSGLGDAGYAATQLGRLLRWTAWSN